MSSKRINKKSKTPSCLLGNGTPRAHMGTLLAPLDQENGQKKLARRIGQNSLHNLT
jgi:hypothetical protein